jgi:hypothetical protein
VNCAICGVRKPKRYCPGVRGDICAVCCGTEREQSVDCPLDCEYLRAAHLHERAPEPDPDRIPDGNVEIGEEFLASNETYLYLLAKALWEGVGKSSGLTDYDVREALAALVSARKALSTGIYYETCPTNPYAATIYETVTEAVEGMRQRERDALGASTALSDSTLLKLLIFLRRLDASTNNGRKRSRAFIDMIRRLVETASPSHEEIGDREEPLIIL